MHTEVIMQKTNKIFNHDNDSSDILDDPRDLHKKFVKRVN